MNVLFDPKPNESFEKFASRAIAVASSGDNILITRFAGARFFIESSDSAEEIEKKYINAHNEVAMMIS